MFCVLLYIVSADFSNYLLYSLENIQIFSKLKYLNMFLCCYDFLNVVTENVFELRPNIDQFGNFRIGTVVSNSW